MSFIIQCSYQWIKQTALHVLAGYIHPPSPVSKSDWTSNYLLALPHFLISNFNLDKDFTCIETKNRLYIHYIYLHTTNLYES